MINYKQRIAIDKKNEKRLLDVCPTLNNNSGIYILTREENEFKYAYIGQAKHILERLLEHFRGYQHIDLSLKKHGLYSENNKHGWNIDFVEFAKSELDNQEQAFIKEYANLGYQLRNKTAGGQSYGKFEINETKPQKGYYDGIRQGELKTIKYIKNIFDKYLDVIIKGKPNKIKERKLEEFKEFLKNNMSE